MKFSELRVSIEEARTLFVEVSDGPNPILVKESDGSVYKLVGLAISGHWRYSLGKKVRVHKDQAIQVITTEGPF